MFMSTHERGTLFSDTTVTMAEKDRKSYYFDKTRRLLGKCGYAQNLALFYVLYVRKNIRFRRIDLLFTSLR